MKGQIEVANDEVVQKEEVRVYQPLVPFPQRLQQFKLDSRYARFLNIFKKLEINIPFVEELAEMLNYAKFMKDIISINRKLDTGRVMSLSANCNSIIQKKLPHKMQDPGSFTISCTIWNFEFGKALCDSGASINLMPLLAVKKLSLGEVTPTAMSLHMAGRSMA